MVLKNLDFNVTLGFILLPMNEKSFAYSEELGAARTYLRANTTLVYEQAGIVDSLLHPSAILIRQVLTRSGRLERNLILIDDEENIIQTLETGIDIHSLYYCGGEVISQQLMQKVPIQTKVYEVTKRTCKKLFEKDKTSRVFAIESIPARLQLSSLQNISRDIVALEDLTISGNIGAIVRTAVAFGVGGIVLLNAESVDIYDRRLIRASRGHIFSLPIVAVTTDVFISFCRAVGFSVVIMAARAGHTLQKAMTQSNRLAIVFGSEKDGCSSTLRDAATLQVQIPTNSRVESLNVSTAAGIMLYNRAWFNERRF